MKMGSIYSASDKALFDAINNATVTASDLRLLFLKHGIVISSKTPRKVLAEHYSRLIHDYGDFQALAKLFDNGKRRERSASFMVNGGPPISEYEAAAHEVIDELKKNTDNAMLITQMDGSLKLQLRYKVYNFNKSEFKQVEIKTATITIEKNDAGVLVRGPQNEKVDEVCRQLINAISDKSQDELKIDEISLELYTIASQRTKFFISLIENLTGYPKHTVTDVYVYKPKQGMTLSQDDESQDDSDSEPDLGIHITKASLKGQGVLESKEFKSLLENPEFYISKIVWQARPSGIDSDIYEFEAQFSEPETCTRFSYLVRGVYKYLSLDEFSKTRQHLDSEDELELNKLIEASARRSLKLLNQ